MNKKTNILLTAVFIFSLTSCGYIGAFLIAKYANCKVKINDRFISSCDLVNGVFIEKLQVDTWDSSGFPQEYYVTQRYCCYNPGIQGVQKYWPDKLYFHKENGHNRWATDTVNIKFRKRGKQRDRIENDSVSSNVYVFHIPGVRGQETCPIDFEKNNWYYINIYDQRVSAVYLYVDENKKFNIYKFNSGVSPI